MESGYKSYLFDGLCSVLKELVFDTNEVKSVTLQRAANKIKGNLKNKFKEGK